MPARDKDPSPSTSASGWIPQPGNRIALPALSVDPGVSLGACLAARRSTRDYEDRSITLDQVSRLLWAAQGVTGVGGLRTSPSAGAIYPLKAYLISTKVDGLAPGVYRYEPDSKELAYVDKGDRRKRLFHAAMGQECVLSSPAAVLLVAWDKRIKAEFGDASAHLIALECGHAAQNFLLEAVALGLGGIGLAKFDNDALRTVVGFRTDEEPEYLLLAGHAAVKPG
jgi:SagB-type dehydrogenase family enzyme